MPGKSYPPMTITNSNFKRTPSFGESKAFLGSSQATVSPHNGRCLRVDPSPNEPWVLNKAVHFYRRLSMFSVVTAILRVSEQVSAHDYVLHPASQSVKGPPILS